MVKAMDIPALSKTNFNPLNGKTNSDLSKLTIIELKDILARQDKLLENRKFINSLPDKGKKISDYRRRLLETLSSKELTEKTTSLLSKLTISTKVDLKHPMASEPIGLKPAVDPYAKILSQALDEALPKEKSKFVLNKTIKELKKHSPLSTPASPSISQSSENGDQTQTDDEEHASIEVDREENVNKPEASRKPSSLQEKYKDTALAYNNSPKRFTELTVEESLELSRAQMEKEKQISLRRQVERTIKIYDELEESDDDYIPDGQEGHDDDDQEQKDIVIRYI